MRRHWRWSTCIKLILAGWRPWRDSGGQVGRSASAEDPPAVERIVREFGGLRLNLKSSVIDINPSVGGDLPEELVRCTKALGRPLYPLGFWEHQDRIYLLADEAGVIYTLLEGVYLNEASGDDVSEWELEPLASSIELALDAVIGGVRRRELRADLCGLGLQGKRWQFASINRPDNPDKM